MLRGIDAIEKASQEAASLGTGDWIRILKIKDGDSALIRFVTDKDDLIKAKFHSVKKITPKGEFSVPVYCTIEDMGTCSNCSPNNLPYNTLSLWAYVYYILHKNQNPKIQAGSNEGIWQPVKKGKFTFYKEEINAIMLFQTKFGYQGRYRQLFVDFANKYGNLCDRDYTWSRVGGGAKDTNYSLMPEDKAPMAKEIKATIKDLPDLGGVICGKIRKWGQAEESKDDEAKKDDSDLEAEPDDKDGKDLF